jgi:HEPN domain-containing protein
MHLNFFAWQTRIWPQVMPLLRPKFDWKMHAFIISRLLENLLRPILVHKHVGFPATHDLNVLLALLPTEVSECPHAHEVPELNIYGAQRRYEEGPTPATREDVDEAAEMASDILRWAKDICSQ